VGILFVLSVYSFGVMIDRRPDVQRGAQAIAVLYSRLPER